jgi:hypothetical protein
MADAVAGAVHDAELGVAVGVDEDAGVEDGHEVVVAAVDHEQRPRRDLGGAGHRSHVAELPRPGVEVGRERRLLDDAHLPGVLEQALGMAGPVVEVGRGAECGDAPHLGVGRRCAERERATRPEAGQPHPGHLLLLAEVADGRGEVLEPTGEREAALGVAAPAEGERHRQPAHLGGQAVGQLG